MRTRPRDPPRAREQSGGWKATAALLLAASLGACFPSFEKRPCYGPGDCPAGQSCSSGACLPAPDAAAGHASADAGVPDARPDAAVDSGRDAPADASSDAGVDAAPDGGAEASLDASEALDAGGADATPVPWLSAPRLALPSSNESHPALAAGAGGYALLVQDDLRLPDGGLRTSLGYLPISTQGTLLAPVPTEIHEAAVGFALQGAVAWSGAVFGVVYTYRSEPADPAELRFTTIDPDAGIAPTVRASRPCPDGGTCASAEAPELVWTGSGFAASWYDGQGVDIYTNTFDRNGAGVHASEVLVDFGGGPALGYAPGPDELGFAWTVWESDDDDDVYFRRLPARGASPFPRQAVTTAVGHARVGRLSWDGSGWGVVYTDDRDDPQHARPEVYFRRLDAEGRPVGTERRITNAGGGVHEVSATWSAERREYGVIWDDERTGVLQVYAARIDAEGNRLSPDWPLSSGDGPGLNPAITWGADAYAAAWFERQSGTWIGLLMP